MHKAKVFLALVSLIKTAINFTLKKKEKKVNSDAQPLTLTSRDVWQCIPNGIKSHLGSAVHLPDYPRAGWDIPRLDLSAWHLLPPALPIL